MTMIDKSIVSADQPIITASDYDRLKQVIESPQYRATHPALLSALKGELERGEVVPPTSVPKRVVTMHSRVRVRDLKSGDVETYELVYPDEADFNEGKLSVIAPLGAALLGTRAGQVIEVDAPAGVRRLKVDKILYQPEAAGDFHL